VNDIGWILFSLSSKLTVAQEVTVAQAVRQINIGTAVCDMVPSLPLELFFLIWVVVWVYVVDL
jgi:hypothetical protein